MKTRPTLQITLTSDQQRQVQEAAGCQSDSRCSRARLATHSIGSSRCGVKIHLSTRLAAVP
jgi:hypothetical protein